MPSKYLTVADGAVNYTGIFSVGQETCSRWISIPMRDRFHKINGTVAEFQDFRLTDNGTCIFCEVSISSGYYFNVIVKESGKSRKISISSACSLNIWRFSASTLEMVAEIWKVT